MRTRDSGTCGGPLSIARVRLRSRRRYGCGWSVQAIHSRNAGSISTGMGFSGFRDPTSAIRHRHTTRRCRTSTSLLNESMREASMPKFRLNAVMKIRGWGHHAIERAYNAFAPRELDVSSIYSLAPRLDQRIPNTVYQTWRSTRLPSFHARGVIRFRQRNSDYSFVFYDDKGMDEYMSSHYAGHPILDVFREIRIPAAKADVWRYCLLFREGGIYCDIDSALAIPFREILKDNP